MDWEREEDLEIGSRQDPEPPQTNMDQDWQYTGEITPEGKRTILGKVLEIVVCTTFSNHIYLFHNSLFLQRKGGPIGLRLTGVVARIVIDTWAKQFQATMHTNGI